ncbi:MAG: hypothetical protein HY279_01055 [Nitrospinae bacterium]|nr:hypothetical protein [Nitrospinota bacterium]
MGESPAIQYRDGYSVYAYKGELVPEDWGKTPTHKWDHKWFLSMKNAELRSVAVEVIGNEKLLSNIDSTG